MIARPLWLMLWFISPAIAYSADVPPAALKANLVSPAPPRPAIRHESRSGTMFFASPTNVPATMGTVSNWQLQYALQPVRIGPPGTTGLKPAAPLIPATNRNEFVSQTSWRVSLQPGSKWNSGTSGSSSPSHVDFRQAATIALQAGVSRAGPETATPVLVSGSAAIGDTKPNLDISAPPGTGVQWNPDTSQMLPGY